VRVDYFRSTGKKNPENRNATTLLENTNKAPIKYNSEMFKIRRQCCDIWEDR